MISVVLRKWIINAAPDKSNRMSFVIQLVCKTVLDQLRNGSPIGRFRTSIIWPGALD